MHARGKYVRIGGSDFEFAYTAIHEIAHTRSHSLNRADAMEWYKITLSLADDMDLYGIAVPSRNSPYLGSDWEQNREMRQNNDVPFSDGMVSWYAYESSSEDISELTASVYNIPGYVRFAASQSPTIRQKIGFLRDKGYISEEQYQSVIQPFNFDEFFEAFTEGASPESMKMSLWYDEDRYDDAYLLKNGLLTRGFTPSSAKYIFHVIEFIHVDPSFVRESAGKSEMLSNKITFLFEHQFITEAQYRYLMSQNGENEISQPQPPPNMFIEAVQHYFSSLVYACIDLQMRIFSRP